MSLAWYYLRNNPISLVGGAIILLVIVATVFAPWVTPYPQSSGSFVDFAHADEPPGIHHLLGTDTVGRDVLTRVVYGYRISLMLSIVVLALAVPVGVSLGLIAGFFKGWAETVIMRITDVFLAIPPLVLALAVMGFAQANLINEMAAVAIVWWPWYTRMVYNLTLSLKQEGYVTAARVIGASKIHLLVREILPNTMSSVLTKVTLDMGFVILIGSSLSFLGLGVQPPTPDLGTMVANGIQYLPGEWWLSLFPGLAILVLVVAFNLVGDGLRDILDVEV